MIRFIPPGDPQELDESRGERWWRGPVAVGLVVLALLDR